MSRVLARALAAGRRQRERLVVLVVAAYKCRPLARLKPEAGRARRGQQLASNFGSSNIERKSALTKPSCQVEKSEILKKVNKMLRVSRVEALDPLRLESSKLAGEQTLTTQIRLLKNPKSTQSSLWLARSPSARRLQPKTRTRWPGQTRTRSATRPTR